MQSSFPQSQFTMPNIGSKLNLCLSFLNMIKSILDYRRQKVTQKYPKVYFILTAYLDLRGVPGAWTEHDQHVVQSLQTERVFKDPLYSFC